MFCLAGFAMLTARLGVKPV